MATTWIKSLHISKTMTKSSAVAAVIDYVENPQKTDGGRLITSYECDSRLADEQFLLAKQEYEYITGRNQGKHDVIAYHIRQAFKPGEVTPEEANEIGRQLVLSFTKGKHAFVVATHIDRAQDHPLKGEYKGYRDCHIEPDWILIYGYETLDDGERQLLLVRTGSHSDILE